MLSGIGPRRMRIILQLWRISLCLSDKYFGGGFQFWSEALWYTRAAIEGIWNVNLDYRNGMQLECMKKLIFSALRATN